MNTLIKQTNNQVQSFTEEQKNLIKKTVADKATDLELQMFMHLANKYQLDPFAREIWFIKYKEGDKPQIFTSRDGYLKIAHSSGVFNGMKSYTIDDEKGNPIKAVCEVYRKDMDLPFKAEIKVSEYKQNSPTWNKYPSAMAIKVAEVFALKRAFTINGLLTSEELPQETSPVDRAVLRQEVHEVEEWNQDTIPTINRDQQVRMFTIAKSETDLEGKLRPLPRWTDGQIKDYLFDLGFNSSSEIPQGEIYEGICEYFHTHAGHFQDVEGQVKI